MPVLSEKEDRIIKKKLRKIVKSFFLKWIQLRFEHSFYVEELVSNYSRWKMEQIKMFVLEKASINNYYWTLYELIKDFKYIDELLSFISPNPFYTPETTLLNILRSSKKLYIGNNIFNNKYFIRYFQGKDEIIQSEKSIKSSIKTFIRHYVYLLFDVKRQPLRLEEIYQLFIKEYVEYSSVQNFEVISVLKNERNMSLENIIQLTNDEGIKSAKTIFYELIKTDYKHFFRIIDDYYGSKSWDIETRFAARLQLFDKCIRKRDCDNVLKLGKELLEDLDMADYPEKKKERLRRIFVTQIERCEGNDN